MPARRLGRSSACPLRAGFAPPFPSALRPPPPASRPASRPRWVAWAAPGSPARPAWGRVAAAGPARLCLSGRAGLPGAPQGRASAQNKSPGACRVACGERGREPRAGKACALGAASAPGAGRAGCRPWWRPPAPSPRRRFRPSPSRERRRASGEGWERPRFSADAQWRQDRAQRRRRCGIRPACFGLGAGPAPRRPGGRPRASYTLPEPESLPVGAGPLGEGAGRPGDRGGGVWAPHPAETGRRGPGRSCSWVFSF